MSNRKDINTSADVIVMILQSDLMLVTGEYDTVDSNTSIMDDTSEYVLEYRSY